MASPRQVLQRQGERLAERGWHALAATELEFIIFKDTFEQAWEAGYRGLTPANLYNVDYSLLGTGRVEPLLRRLRKEMGGAGMWVESAKGECNFGQHEIAFRYTGLVTKADEHTLFKMGAKEIAAQEGCSLTFMAKYDAREGSSCHIHISLRDDSDQPVFSGEGHHGFSAVFEQFMAGLLVTLPELALFIAPNINSYKRFVRGSFAPTALVWGRDNRSSRASRRRPRPVLATGRVPGARWGREPLPGSGGDGRRWSLRDRGGSRARARVRGERLRLRQAATADHLPRGGRPFRYEPRYPQGLWRRGCRPLFEHGARRARGIRFCRHRLGALQGVRTAVSGQRAVVNPATEETIATISPLGLEATDDAIVRATEALPAWRAVSPGDRARLLRRFAEVVDAANEELARIEVANSGHTISNARWEAGNVRDVLAYYSGAPERLCGRQIPVPGGVDVTFHEPIGVVGIIVPWNFPMPIASWGYGPALAAGNTVVLKPADLTPLTAIRIGELALEAGIPEHVFQVLPGRGSVVGWRFVTHPLVGKICFTGSTEVGQKIMAGCAEQVKRVTLELGGKSANIIFADADVPAAAAAAPYAVFDNAGQDCCARSRILVEQSGVRALHGAFRIGGQSRARHRPHRRAK